MDPWLKCSVIGSGILVGIILFKMIFQHAWGNYRQKYDLFDHRGRKKE